MICFPNAKINIGLNIIDKRNDEFHNIESIFYPIGLCDVLEIIENKEKSEKRVEFTNSGLQIDGNTDDNTCVKAYNLLHNKFNIPPVKIHLHKVIPFGAGLGGGSSNGAFALNCLNNLFDVGLSKNELIEYSLILGSDCAFFIYNQPMLVKGRGEILMPIDLDLSDLYIVVLNPEIHISTKEAYAQIILIKPDISINQLIQQPINNWKNSIKNDFEVNFFKEYPKIKELKDLLYKAGAMYASITGSGSSVYGLFKKNINIVDTNLLKYLVWEGKCKP